MSLRKPNIFMYVYSIFFIVLATIGCSDGKIGASESSSSSKSAPISSDNSSVVNPLFVEQNNVELYSGDSYRVSITGGLKPYSFEDSNGHFDQSGYIYNAPFSSSPTTEIVKVFDSLGAALNISFKIRTYEPEVKARSNIVTAYHSSTVRDLLVLPDGTIFVSAYVGVTTTVASYANILLRSLDGGNTYSEVYNLPGSNFLKLLLLPNGSILLMNQVTDSSGKSNVSIKISSNRGDSFSEISSISDLTLSNIFIGKVSNSLFLFGTRLNPWGEKIGVLYKSTNEGVSWTKTSEFDFNYLTALCTPEFVGFIELSANNFLVSINISDYGAGASFPDMWLVQKTSDGGASWTSSDAFVFAAGRAIYGDQIFKLSNGNLLTVGYGFSATGVATVFSRLSTDSGASWSTVNTYNHTAGKAATMYNAFLASSGKVWMMVTGRDSSNVVHKVLRSSTDGVSWTTVADESDSATYRLQEDAVGNLYFDRTFYVLNAGFNYRTEMEIVKRTPGNVVTTSSKYKYNSKFVSPSSSLLDANGNMLTGGFMTTATYGLNSWVTQISTDNGANWTDSDIYNYPASTKSSNLVKMIKTSSGSILAVGNALDSSGYAHLIVRKGTPNGIGAYTWTTVNDSRELGTSQEAAVDILESSSGRIFVTATSAYSGVQHWIVKKSSADLSTWTTVDNSSISGSVYNYAIGLLQDSQGRIYSVGYATGSAMAYAIRISDDDGVTWSNQRIWNTYTKNYLTISGGSVLYNVGVKGSNFTFEKSVDRGQTWTVLGQKTFSGTNSVNSIKVEGDSIFIFGSFSGSSIYSSTLRYNITQNQLTSLDSLSANNKTIGIAAFDCQNQSWCLLSSQVGTLIGETLATIRRMSK